MTRLTITFDENEVEALRSAALRAMRPTKDHARFLIASALGMTGEKSKASQGQKESTVATGALQIVH